MFKKAKIKIFFCIMISLILLWSGTMFFIYISYVQSVATQNYEFLQEHAHLYTSKYFNDEKIPPEDFEPNPDVSEKPEFALTTFYTVAFSKDGSTFETMNDKPTVHSNDELESLARTIVNESDTNVGVDGNLIYYHIDKGTYDLVVFMENAVISERYRTFLHYFWIYNTGTFIFCIFLSILFANLIVRPLEKNYKYQKQFVSNASHELKTPVSVINANAEILSRDIGDNKWLSNIRYENERMGVLIGHLLDLSRSEVLQAENKLINLSKLVEGEILPFESIAYEKGLNIKNYVQKGVSIYGDSEQIKQLVDVLIDNAIEHSAGVPSDIEVHLKKEFYGYVKLRVINAGEPIPEDVKEKLFERFYKADKFKASSDGHYGLGLAIAKNIVDSHKGKIQVLCYDGKVEFQVLMPINKNLKF